MAESNALRDEIALATEKVAYGDVNDRIVVPLSEEFVTVDKRVEETGVVRVHKQTSERSETVRFETNHESVSVERVPIDRIVEGPVEIRQEGDVTVIPVLEEVVVVEKRLMLREEVRVTRTRTTVPEERTVTLRKEQAVVERDAPNR